MLDSTSRGAAIAAGLGWVLLVAAYGCASLPSGSQPQQASSPAAIPTTRASGQNPSAGTVSAAPTASCPAAAQPTMAVGSAAPPDGKSFGFIRHFDGSAVYFDPAEMLDGRAAVQAAREDGELAPGEDLPEPFYIRNRDTTPVRIPASREFFVTLIDNRNAPRHRLNAEGFTRLYCGIPLPSWLYANPESLPVHLRVSNGHVIKADEQYLP